MCENHTERKLTMIVILDSRLTMRFMYSWKSASLVRMHAHASSSVLCPTVSEQSHPQIHVSVGRVQGHERRNSFRQ